MIKSTLEENLQFFTNRYKTVYGSNFKIKPEGVIDNIAVAQSLVKMDLEDKILFVKKAVSPSEASGVEQDKLYSNGRLVRRQATYTIVQRTIQGTPNTQVLNGSLLIEDTVTKNQFKLNSDITLGADGLAVGSFTSELIGAITLENDATLEIKTPLANVVGVYYTIGNDINVGLTYEDDASFRKRWLNWSKANSSIKADLLPLVDNSGDIIVRQNRGLKKYSDLELHTMNIHINSAENDNVIAQTIFDNLTDGVELAGAISVVIKDDSNQDVDIKFDRATAREVWIKSTVKKVEGKSDADVRNDVLTAIKDYYTNTAFVMGDEVIGNRFNSGIDAKSSVDYPISTEVSLNGTTYNSIAEIGEFEIPVFGEVEVEIVE